MVATKNFEKILSKNLNIFNSAYFHHEFVTQCIDSDVTVYVVPEHKIYFGDPNP